MARFEIDERKLRSALPPRTSSTWEDLKWSSAFLGIIGLFIASLALVVWLFFFEPSSAFAIVAVLLFVPLLLAFKR